jgi:tetratricopeptide (TPR) repeat protein
MNMINRRILVNILLVVIPAMVFSQKGVEDGSRFGHGEDSIRCIRNLSLYREYVKHGNYADAIGPWRIVFNECPTATKNIYIDGAKMYNDYIHQESNPATQDAFIDTLMMVYNQRIKYYKETGSVRGRQGVDLMRYKLNDPEKLQLGYDYLKESVTLMKNRTSIAVIATFMKASYLLFEHGILTDMQVIDDYAMVSDIIDYLLANDPDNENNLKVKESVDLGFIISGAPTCESLISYFGPDYENRKSELSYLKKVVTFLGTLDCETDPLYAKAAEDLYTLEPSSAAAFSLAKLFVTKEEYGKSVKYYLEALENEQEIDNKAEYYYQLGVITNAKLNQPEKAREYALKALEIRPDWGEPYILIGDAYASSKDCFNDDFEKSTVYWAAVDKFIAARNVDENVAEKAGERISTYSQYFPDVETVFFYGLQEGDSYQVGCWINETTKVRSK